MMNGHNIRACITCGSTIALVLLAILTSTALSQDQDARQFQTLLTAGDPGGAAAEGVRLLSRMKADHPGSGAVASLETRIASVANIKSLTTYKLDVIRQSIAASSPTPFRYVSPTPSELYTMGMSGFRSSTLTLGDLSTKDASFARSYAYTVTSLADSEVLESYSRVIGAKPDEKDAAMARAYLSAYIIGMHDDSTFPGVLSLLAKNVTGGGLPVFLVDDSLSVLNNPRAAYQALNALAAVKWAAWPRSDELRLFKATARAAEKAGDYEVAALCWSKIVADGDSVQKPDALNALITVLGEKAHNFSGAAQTCGDYLKSFPNGSDAVNIEYLKGRYEYQAGEFDVAIVDIGSFIQRHGDSDLVPSAMLFEGLIYAGQRQTDKAIRTYGDVIAKYPRSQFAVKAQFLEGIAYWTAQRYAEAQEAFQRVVDFYPDDPLTSQATVYIKSAQQMLTPR